MSNSRGKLYLIPTVIAEGTQQRVIPPDVIQVLPQIRYFLAEDIRTARRYLSSLKVYESIEPLHLEMLNKDTPEAALPELLKPVSQGENVGILSESGCPGVADPGARAVWYAHQQNISVVPLVGPSSLLLALMGSGLNGQHFAFHGYLPIEAREASQMIRDYEKESRMRSQTQIFIETPYRNNSLFGNLLKALHPDTLLCVALDLTSPNQLIRTQSIRTWRAKPQEWPKAPAVFLFLAN